MSTQLIVNPTTGEIPPEASLLTIEADPETVLERARRAAVALKEVVSKKAKPVIFKGEQYLEFEDWQTLGRFANASAKVVSVEPVALGAAKGFHAVAVAIDQHGRELTRAEAWCLGDEANWKDRPLFMLASMSQTRACAKALRNVLSWIAVLAGYRATPAEELDASLTKSRQPVERPTPQQRRDDDDKVGSQLISEPQAKRLFAVSRAHGWDRAQVQALLGRCGYTRSSEITKSDYDTIIATLETGPAQHLDDDPGF
jgi:hypothetical protein